MNNPPIEPVIINGGSAFRGNYLTSFQPLSNLPKRSITKVVSLTEWCSKNFITKRTGRKLIRLKYLIGFRQKGQWWVTANPDCLEQLLEYLGIEELAFDVVQS